MFKLYVDLVPSSCWYSNIRNLLSKEDWDNIRKKTYKKANYKCEICGGKGDKHPVEAHERWQFDEINKVQKLVNIEALCPNCHQATHYGLARIRGKEKIAFNHLKKVNNCDDFILKKHIYEQYDIFEKRSKISHWKLDVTWLFNYISLSEETKSIINKAIQ